MQDRYLGSRDRLRPVDYFPARQAERPPEERDQYRATEVAEHRDGEVDGRPVGLDYRVVFVWSESKARQEATTRERHAAEVRAEFEAAERNPGRYSLTTTETVLRRLEAAKGKDPGGGLFTYQLRQARGGQFHLTWCPDAAALERRQSLEGVYALRTNLPARTHPLADVLRAYEGQSHVERRFHHLKGPLAAAPVFLRNPDRIAGLLCVLVWALMVLALTEPQARRALGDEPLHGLYPEGRPVVAPGAERAVHRDRPPG